MNSRSPTSRRRSSRRCSKGSDSNSSVATDPKMVELYAQGDVNLVINRERNSFAHSFQLLHGAAVCAIALRVDRVERAVERARAIGCTSHTGRTGPGEATIPAIGGVEGSLVYFVDRRGAGLAQRLHRRNESSDRSGPLKAIDHLSNVVRRNEFLSWLLFYESALGLTAEPQIEVYDPHGDFYSRSLRSENGALRIALNVGVGGATGVSRFLDKFGGAGYQQIAISTNDIFVAVEAARRRVSSSCLSRTIITTIWRRGSILPPICCSACASSACSTIGSKTGSSSTSTRALSTIASFSKFSSATTMICSAQRTRRCGWRRRRRSTTRKRA